MQISLDSAKASSPGILFVGASRIDAPLLGGTLVPSPTIALPWVTSPSGSFEINTNAPAVASGVTIYFQAWISDASAALGTTASNGLSVVTP